MLLRRALLALAVLASAAAATVVGFAVYLVVEGYSGGGDPQSVAPLAFPIAFLVLAVVRPAGRAGLRRYLDRVRRRGSQEPPA